MPCFDAVGIEIDDSDLDVKTLIGDDSARWPALREDQLNFLVTLSIGTAPTTYPAPRQQIFVMIRGRDGITGALSRPFEGVGNLLLSLLICRFVIGRVLKGK